jgi:hypothetical protein
MLRRLLVPAAAALALTVGAPLTAHAATLNLDDARGDVYRLSNTGEFERAVGERRADILRTTVRHTQRALVVRTKLLELRREGTIAMGMRLRTNEGTYREAAVEASRRIGWRGQSSVMARRGRAVECSTEHKLNYAADVITLRIPRSCMNEPRWVQTTVISMSLSRRQFLVDNPHNERPGFRVWSSRIRRG